MKAVRTSETSVYFNETARRYIQQGCHFIFDIKAKAVPLHAMQALEGRGSIALTHS
jgi:hypothetical protein